jgi:hypothetical protein
MRIEHYGNFWLTQAIRPGPGVPIVPREGFRLTHFRAGAGPTIPVLIAAVSRERLFDAFVALLPPLGNEVDVVLESSHHLSQLGQPQAARHSLREGIERPILVSYLCTHEELLLHDGCTGLTVLSRIAPAEVQFDEHKLLMVYAYDLEPFEAALRQQGVPRVDDLTLITQGDHLHQSRPEFVRVFQELAQMLGVGESVDHING